MHAHAPHSYATDQRNLLFHLFAKVSRYTVASNYTDLSVFYFENTENVYGLIHTL